MNQEPSFDRRQKVYTWIETQKYHCMGNNPVTRLNGNLNEIFKDHDFCFLENRKFLTMILVFRK